MSDNEKTRDELIAELVALRDECNQLRTSKATTIEEQSTLVEQQQQLLRTIREISTPVLPVYDEVLVLPLIGAIDSNRSAQLLEALLTSIQKYQADTVIIDISGVPMVDTSVANHLLQATRAGSLLGAHCMLVGVSAEVAQTLVQLGVNLDELMTYRNLQDGLEEALRQHGKRITSNQ